MKRILSILVLIAFLWLGYAAYQLFNTNDGFGRAFWTTCLSLTVSLVLAALRISLIGKSTPSRTMIGLSIVLLLWAVIAWWMPEILIQTWNYFIGVFILYLGVVLHELLADRNSLPLKIVVWIPWITLGTGVIFNISTPLFYTICFWLLLGGTAIAVFGALKKKVA